MRLSLDCISCFMRQALGVSRMATEDENKQGEVLRLVALGVRKSPLKKRRLR